MIYILLADGFEEIEALCPLDILRRAGLSVLTVGIDKQEIEGAHGITVKADISSKDLPIDSIDKIDALILPGGMPGTKNLDNSRFVHAMIDSAIANDSYIAAICAAPMILGKRGMLKGLFAVCYPGFEEYLIDATVPNGKKVVVDQKIVTAKGMGVANEFGFTLVELLCSKEKALSIRKATISD